VNPKVPDKIVLAPVPPKQLNDDEDEKKKKKFEFLLEA
jgi:hypothetical protein